MSVGYPVTRTDLDNRMGGMIVAVRDALNACVQFKALLDDTTVLPDATLTGLGYSAGDITQLRAAFAAMKSLSDISRSAATQPAVNDFWFDAKHLAGLNFH
jgi:hypothetical protein